MSLIIKILITVIGAAGIVITTEKIIVEFSYEMLPAFIIFTAVFGIGIMTIAHESRKLWKHFYNKTLKKKESDRST